MKAEKRAITVILTLCVLLTLTACGGSEPAPPPEPTATPGPPATLDEAQEKLKKQTWTANDALSEYAYIAHNFAIELETGGWNENASGLTDLNEEYSLSSYPISGFADLPEGIAPADEDALSNAVSVSALPDELRGQKFIALYKCNEWEMLLGDFMARLPDESRANTLDEAQAVLFMRYYLTKHPTIIGKAYDCHYELYAWKIGSDTIYELYNQTTLPPPSGLTSEGGALYGSRITKREIWYSFCNSFYGSVKVEDEYGSLSFSVKAGECVLSAVEGDRATLDVPAEAGGYPVTGIADCKLSEVCPSLEEARLPDSLRWIGEKAFYSCGALRSVNLPSSLVVIGDHAFYDCELLESPVFPTSLRSIGDWAFAACESISEFRLPEGLETVGENTISYCRNAGVILPTTLKTPIYDFLNDVAIRWLVIPEGFTGEFSKSFWSMNDYPLCVYVPASIDIEIDYYTVGRTSHYSTWGIPSRITVYTPEGSSAESWAKLTRHKYEICASPDDMPRPYNGAEGGFEYYILNDEAYITSYTGGWVSDLVVPATLGGFPVKTLLDLGYTNTKKPFHSITFPEGIALDNNCIQRNTVENLYIPASVTDINEDFLSIMGAYIHPVIHSPDGSAAQAWAEKERYASWEEWEP